ncbi:hypothetical protein K457DRAFT_14028 [Linnemannia elongata AG-77]|uniref:Uncharacterized protein n=1 Tax=Linnemannia elongata AG-77 TaxID=1314771 RepID=A0A197KAT8_9FUNG|nr:hypothetical protein K457DRAFT_14028 [Linnemannia elongata AG-77]
MSEIPEIPDYNKIYHTWSYSSSDPLDSVPDPQIQQNPRLPSQPMNTTVDNTTVDNTTVHNTTVDNTTVNNSNGYGPLDYGHDLPPVTTAHTNNTVNMAPFQEPTSSNDQQRTSSSSSAGQVHRRSSVGHLLDWIIGVDSSHQIPLRKTVSQPATANISNSGRRRSSIAKFLKPDPQPNEGSGANLGRRRSSAFTSLGFKTDAGGNEHKGPYANVSRSQAEYMDRIREAERNMHLTHNKDGLPLPKDNTMQAGGRRRSSVVKILGFDKPLLAR